VCCCVLLNYRPMPRESAHVIARCGAHSAVDRFFLRTLVDTSLSDKVIHAFLADPCLGCGTTEWFSSHQATERGDGTIWNPVGG
jgi:hypothetical protein